MGTRNALQGKRAFVMGGTGGVGFAAALALGTEGASLFIHGSRPERLESALTRLKEAGISAEGSFGQIDSPESASIPWKRIEESDILVCAYGPFLQKPLQDTSPADWQRLASLNLALPGALSSAALRGMTQRKWGRIVLFGGTRTDSIRGFLSNAAYAAAKTGISTIAKSIAAACAHDGIASLAICPGFVDTEYLDDATRIALAAKTPDGRLINAQAIGGFISGLVAMDEPYWNGTTITFDGGLFAW